MSNLIDKQKKFLRAEVAEKIMEHLIGLTEKNKPAIRRVVKRSSKKIITAYCQTMKQQHKKCLKQTAKMDKASKVVTGADPVVSEQTNLKVC